MIVFYWIAGIALALTGLPAALFFVLYIATGEEVPHQRALMFYRWFASLFLLTFNLLIWRHIVATIWLIWHG